ncbi:unnamed protein product [Didymodactylos carnosus]|uniref:beta-N-acetylhexosaminidase n=1 Tax=Didymodactylos carnosus TaxID=1234261 RepID=A0A813VDI6_9BILA|nr:unnamed protein product [Didymodactylos carnosus]CAF3623194.1 unnamed protein product [Didymodactylos carnosus]
MKDNNMSDATALHTYYAYKILNITKDIGMIPVVWQDVWDEKVKLPNDTIIQVWKDKSDNDEFDNWASYLNKVARDGYNVILSSPWYLNYIRYGKYNTNESVMNLDFFRYYEVEPLRAFSGNEQEKNRILGGEACLWAEFVDGTNLLPRIWPAASAVAERLWSDRNVNNPEDAQFRLDVHRCRLLRRGIPAQPILNGYCGNYEPDGTSSAGCDTASSDRRHSSRRTKTKRLISRPLSKVISPNHYSTDSTSLKSGTRTPLLIPKMSAKSRKRWLQVHDDYLGKWSYYTVQAGKPHKQGKVKKTGEISKQNFYSKYDGTTSIMSRCESEDEREHLQQQLRVLPTLSGDAHRASHLKAIDFDKLSTSSSKQGSIKYKKKRHERPKTAHNGTVSQMESLENGLGLEHEIQDTREGRILPPRTSWLSSSDTNITTTKSKARIKSGLLDRLKAFFQSRSQSLSRISLTTTIASIDNQSNIESSILKKKTTIANLIRDDFDDKCVGTEIARSHQCQHVKIHDVRDQCIQVDIARPYFNLKYDYDDKGVGTECYYDTKIPSANIIYVDKSIETGEDFIQHISAVNCFSSSSSKDKKKQEIFQTDNDKNKDLFNKNNNNPSDKQGESIQHKMGKKSNTNKNNSNLSTNIQDNLSKNEEHNINGGKDTSASKGQILPLSDIFHATTNYLDNNNESNVNEQFRSAVSLTGARQCKCKAHYLYDYDAKRCIGDPGAVCQIDTDCTDNAECPMGTGPIQRLCSCARQYVEDNYRKCVDPCPSSTVQLKIVRHPGNCKRFVDCEHNSDEQRHKTFQNYVKQFSDMKCSILPEVELSVHVNGFNNEQIYQQLKSINDKRLKVFMNYIVKNKNKTKTFGDILEPPKVEEADNEEIITTDTEVPEQVLEKEADNLRIVKNKQRKSVTFFDMNAMSTFLEEQDANESTEPTKKTRNSEVDTDDDFDLDEDDDLLLPDAEQGTMYEDFFDPPKTIKSKEKKEKKQKRAIDDQAEIDNFKDKIDDDDQNDLEGKSDFEKHQIQLKKQIKSIEEEMLSAKPWQLSGETDSYKRPENSLLEEYLQFDRNTRLPPVITTDTTNSIEQLVKQRIRDKAFDDVVRKKKTAEDANAKTYKKDVILEHEKSKMSLAQVYEKEYVKQQTHEEIEKKDERHETIRKMLQKLFVEFDALSNFRFTPRPPVPEVTVVNNLPAIMVEEIVPTTVNDATLLAPEEVHIRPKGDVKSATEKTKTDKKHDRRLLKQKRKEKAQEKEKTITTEANDEKKQTQEEKRALLKKLGKMKNVRIEKTDKKHSKTKTARGTTQFFQQLQQTTTSTVEKRRRPDSSFSTANSKKLKL